MNTQKFKKDIFEALKKLAVIKRTDVTSDCLFFMSEELSNYQPSEVVGAIEKCLREKKFFPDISEILEIISPPLSESEEALMLANQVIELCSNCSRFISEKEIIERVGEKGLRMINFFGLDYLIRMEYDQINTVRAQLRESAKSIMKSERPPMKELTHISEFLKIGQ
jgi:hypothetical protein